MADAREIVTSVGLCSQALDVIGVPPIKSFADRTKEAQVASIVYSDVRDMMLASYPWRFMSRRSGPTGITEAEFPAHFCRALVARLAAELCIPLTNSPPRARHLFKRAEDGLRVSGLEDSGR